MAEQEIMPTADVNVLIRQAVRTFGAKAKSPPRSAALSAPSETPFKTSFLVSSASLCTFTRADSESNVDACLCLSAREHILHSYHLLSQWNLLSVGLIRWAVREAWKQPLRSPYFATVTTLSFFHLHFISFLWFLPLDLDPAR